MGCFTSVSAPKLSEQAKPQSYRFSCTANGYTPGMTTPMHLELSEDDRAWIANLDSKDLIEILRDHSVEGEIKMGIGSTTDLRTTSLNEKNVSKIGDELDLSMTLGYACRKGLKPTPNQDSWLALQVDGNFSMYAVFDGHGQKGHDVSNFVKENLPKIIIQDADFKTDEMPTVLKNSFEKIQKLIVAADHSNKLSATMSGTTATIVVHDHIKSKLYIAHVADSAAVLGKQLREDSQVLSATALTHNHVPNSKEEKQRIEESGGSVIFDGFACHRVYAKNARYPALNMSRCLGDLVAHDECGISAEPAVSVIDIGPDDKVLLLCSDGVWEFITHLEAVEFACLYPVTTQTRAMASAGRLAREAWDRWIREEGGAVVDDITVILVYLNTDIV